MWLQNNLLLTHRCSRTSAVCVWPRTPLMSSVSVLEPNDNLNVPNEAVGSFKSTCSVDCFKYILFISRVLRSNEAFIFILFFFYYYKLLLYCSFLMESLDSSTLTYFHYFRLKNRKPDSFLFFTLHIWLACIILYVGWVFTNIYILTLHLLSKNLPTLYTKSFFFSITDSSGATFH